MAMFDAVKKGFRNAIHSLEGKRELTEENIDEALKTVRMALFEADVNFRVVKRFIERVKERAIGEVVHVRAKTGGQTLRVSPGDVFVKICHDELEALMGPASTELTFVQDRLGPTVILMVGLQGSGKTTTSAKLARWVMHHLDKKPLLVAADVYRPAAIDQLRVLGERLDVPVYAEPGGNPPEIVQRAYAQAKETGRNVLIVDTAGRLAVDDLLMSELEEITRRVTPHNILLVVDAMIGQDAVNTAREFNDRLELDGFIMTKLDGDARGGAALSIKEVTGKPIKFVGVGENMDGLQEFEPAGFADRILGMGDVRSLVGRIENIVTTQEVAKKEADAHRLMRGEFDFDDFLEQIRMIKRMGSLKDIIEMLPFASQLPADMEIDDKELVRIEAMIQSMTREERQRPELVKQQITRQRRIARGSGRDVQEVTDLVQRFDMMKSMFAQVNQGQGGLLSRIPGLRELQQMKNMSKLGGGGFPGMGGMGGFPGMGGMGGFPGMGGMPGMGGFPGMGGPQQPQLPRGFSTPGQRMVADSDATKARIDAEKERRKKQKARDARKKNR